MSRIGPIGQGVMRRFLGVRMVLEIKLNWGNDARMIRDGFHSFFGQGYKAFEME